MAETMTAGWLTITVALLAGTASLLIAIVLIRWLDPAIRVLGLIPNGNVSSRRELPESEPMRFLFRNRGLVDATRPARVLLDSLSGGSDWSRLQTYLAARFGDVSPILATAVETGRAEATAGRGLGSATLRLVAEQDDGLLRLTLVDPAAQNTGITVDSQALSALEYELGILRESVDCAPVLIWRETLATTDGPGQVDWANGTYLREVEMHLGKDVGWPMPRLIDLPAADQRGRTRVQVELDDQLCWFDCHIERSEHHRTIFAVPADDAVRAERSLREFVQTLTKTFADLPTGLAVFDRQRRLQLFNPALTNMTGLSASFLTARPTLSSMLDALRETRMVPEPRNYHAWRDMIANLEAAAASGHHVETWPLPGGQTYRVTGRPHPDGAISFLFEDISSEVTMTRRFRTEVALGAEILDALDHAVVSFDASGRLLGVNRVYAEVWGNDLPGTVRGHAELWRRAGQSAGADALRRALTGMTASLAGAPVTGTLTAPGGDILVWRVKLLQGGRRLVTFDKATPVAVEDAAQTVVAESAPVAGLDDPDTLRPHRVGA